MTGLKEMTQEEKQTAIPKLRFSEFRNAPAWTSKELRSIAEPVSERAKEDDANHILTLSAEHGLVLQSEYFGKQVAGTNAERYFKIRRNDFVYNDRTTKASEYGTIKRLTKHPHGVVSPIYKCFRFRNEESPGFWEYYFESGAHEWELHKLANEGARAGRFNVTIERFLSTRVFSPETTSGEQQKIAECLSTLDELIEVESRKLDALKDHKKGLMQQLFPREGETRPRLRFPEFRDAHEWRERSVSDLLVKVSIPVKVKEDDVYREIGVRSHGNGIFHKSHIAGKALGEKRVFRVVENALVLNIVFAWEQAVATTSRLEADMIASHRFPMYVSKEGECDVRFIKYGFLTPRGKQLLGIASPGGAGRNRTLGQDEFEKLRLRVPTREEQVRIADVIDAANEFIAAQSAKLEALRTHKRGLMQQLFPNPSEFES